MEKQIVTVFESMYTISGVPLAILQCNDGPLPKGTILTASDNFSWLIEELQDRALMFNKPSQKHIYEKMLKENLYFYSLSYTTDKLSKPEVGWQLEVTPPQ